MSNGMLTLQQQNMGSVGLSIDSSQLLQITQLMNDLQQSGGAHQMIIDSTPNDHQQQTTTHVLDIMGQQHGQQHDLFNAVNMSNNMLVSPIKIDQSSVSSSNGQVYMLDPGGGGGAQQNQHQQMGQNQVHTIMLNGQPALFIPASSAISSNLLCQMMQINNGNQPNSTATNFDLHNSTPVQLQLANGTDYSNLLSNQLIMSTEGATVNTKISPGRDVSSAQSMVNIINGCQTENAQYNNIALIPVSSTSTASTSNGHNQTTAVHTNEMPNFVCKLESFEQDEQYQQQHQHQHQHQQSTSLTQINQHLHQQQQQQQHIAATAHSQIPQQVICIQPDGNITLQTLQSIHQLQQQQQQQQQQSASMIVQPTAQILVNKPVNVTANGNQKGKKAAKEKQTSTNANKTIANLGASAGKAAANEKTPSSNKGKAKVGELLSDVRGKKNQQSQQQQQQQIAIQPAQASVQYQIQPFDQQQWIIFNNMADLNAINNTTATLVASAPVQTVAATTNTTTNTTGGTSVTSNSSASSTTNASKLNDIFDIPAKVPELYSNKKRRKACDCPNCVKIKQNGLSKDDQGKKRTHKCHKCPKEYNKTSHLRAHLRGHDNFRPYVCDFKQCGKSFTRSDELKRHRRIHFDDRNFPCVICKKRFLRSDHLNKHLLVHTKAASTFTSSPFKLSSSSSSASRNSTTSPNKNSNNSSTTPSKKSKHVNEIITESSSSNLNAADSAASMLSSSSSSSSSASASAIESSLLLT